MGVFADSCVLCASVCEGGAIIWALCFDAHLTVGIPQALVVARPASRVLWMSVPQKPGQKAIAGGGKVNQIGLFLEAAPGISLSNLARHSKGPESPPARLLPKVKHEQVLKVWWDFWLDCTQRLSSET